MFFKFKVSLPWIKEGEREREKGRRKKREKIFGYVF
jgi:hypothetical protein